MSIKHPVTNHEFVFGDTNMSIKLGSIVIVLMMFFIAKISFETAMAEKNPETVNERSPASIDQSYNDHMNKR